MPIAMNVADKVLFVERDIAIPAIKASNIAAVNQ